MKTVKELQDQLNAKRDELAKIYDAKKTTVDGEARYDLNVKELEDVRARNKEIDDIAVELEGAKEVDSIYQKNVAAIREGNRPGSQLPLTNGTSSALRSAQREVKSLGQLFVEAEGYKNRQRKRDIVVQLPDFDYLEAKTLMETGAGFAPQSIRTGRVVEYAHRRPVVADLIPQTPTEQAAVVYMEETTFTNNAATRAEGGQAGESALAYTERSKTVREIAHFLPVTEIQLEDVPVVNADPELLLREVSELLLWHGARLDGGTSLLEYALIAHSCEVACAGVSAELRRLVLPHQSQELRWHRHPLQLADCALARIGQGRARCAGQGNTIHPQFEAALLHAIARLFERASKGSDLRPHIIIRGELERRRRSRCDPRHDSELLMRELALIGDGEEGIGLTPCKRQGGHCCLRDFRSHFQLL